MLGFHERRSICAGKDRAKDIRDHSTTELRDLSLLWGRKGNNFAHKKRHKVFSSNNTVNISHGKRRNRRGCAEAYEIPEVK